MGCRPGNLRFVPALDPPGRRTDVFALDAADRSGFPEDGFRRPAVCWQERAGKSPQALACPLRITLPAGTRESPSPDGGNNSIAAAPTHNPGPTNRRPPNRSGLLRPIWSPRSRSGEKSRSRGPMLKKATAEALTEAYSRNSQAVLSSFPAAQATRRRQTECRRLEPGRFPFATSRPKYFFQPGSVAK